MKDVYITLRFHVFANHDMSPETVHQVGRHMERTFQSWSDGRRPFHVEAMQASLVEIAEAAVQDTTFDMLREIYGDDRVELSPGSSTLRASAESEKLNRDLYVTNRGEPAVIEVSTVAEVPGRWKVLRRDDIKADGSPGDYDPSSKVFASDEEAQAYADTISRSRGPIIVPESRVKLVLAALNFVEDET